MTGVRFARLFPNGDCELEYTDGSKERARVDLNGGEEFFALVSAVQSMRAK